MTGTPVENHLQDLWNLFDFVMPGYLGSHYNFDFATPPAFREIINKPASGLSCYITRILEQKR